MENKNMKDDIDTFYDDVESNEDSKSDAKVALIIIIVAVITALYWVSGQ
tara:strand:- start:808 stop:954 length:147 start_codon:yes stop_codon:yes gene_type:complete